MEYLSALLLYSSSLSDGWSKAETVEKYVHGTVGTRHAASDKHSTLIIENQPKNIQRANIIRPYKQQ